MGSTPMRLSTAATTVLVMASIPTPASAAPPKRPAPHPTLAPFSATASFGENVPTLGHGPLSSLLEGRQHSIGDIAILAVVSTEDDMLITGEPSILVPAGDDRTLFYGQMASPDGAGYVGADARVGT